MTVFISGGAKNGKSYLAQRIVKILARGEKLYYMATMDPHDEEDDMRIARHIAERDGWGFETIECPYCCDISGGQGSYLFDSVTALLSNEMFSSKGFDDKAGKRVESTLLKLISQCDNLVIVSDYIYSDALQYDALTQAYRCALAKVDRAIASVSDCVIEVCASSVTFHKGGWQLIEKV